MDTPKKSLGQHWLYDPRMLQAVAAAAEVTADDTVLEVGPGLGTLTKVLSAEAARVVVVEFDDELAQKLATRVPAANLRVVHEDILKFDLSQLPKDYKVAANIPYYLTSKLVRTLLESPNPPLVTSLLVQKEVAERLAARPGELSILGVSAQFYAEVELKEVVPAALFTPPPKVDSQIVQLRRRPTPLFDDVTAKDFFRIVRAGFSEKRKKLRSSLSGGLHLEKDVVDRLLEKAAISAQARAQELDLEDWHRLVICYNTSHHE
jgi:16S rRNA (adenine1518-N6/adenine1519-N6)-dimethyltransferase